MSQENPNANKRSEQATSPKRPSFMQEQIAKFRAAEAERTKRVKEQEAIVAQRASLATNKNTQSKINPQVTQKEGASPAARVTLYVWSNPISTAGSNITCSPEIYRSTTLALKALFKIKFPLVANQDAQQSGFFYIADMLAHMLNENPFLEIKDLNALRCTNRINYGTYEHNYYLSLITQKIGPNFAKLINEEDKTTRQAYERHTAIIDALGNTNSLEEFVVRITEFPDYYPNTTDLIHLIPNLDSLDNFTRRFPQQADQLLQYVLKKDVLLLHFSRNGESFLDCEEGFWNFVLRFPTYTNQALQWVLTNDANFRYVFTNLLRLSYFERNFPSSELYLPAILQRVLTNEAAFRDIFRGVEDLGCFKTLFSGSEKYLPAILQRVLTNDIDFARIISKALDLQLFTLYFPHYAQCAKKRLAESHQRLRRQSLAHVKEVLPAEDKLVAPLRSPVVSFWRSSTVEGGANQISGDNADNSVSESQKDNVGEKTI